MRVHVTRTVSVHESASPAQVDQVNAAIAERYGVPSSRGEYQEMVRRVVADSAEDFLWREREHVDVSVNVSVAEFEQFVESR